MDALLPIFLPVVVLGGLGTVFGAVLGVAAKKFAVDKDEREEQILGILPGANCGGCGFPGCSGFAAAVVSGEATTNGCAVGGSEVTALVAGIMGVEPEDAERHVAFVRCSGGARSNRKYDYVGLDDCFSALNAIGGGPLTCRFGCLGLGSCTRVCQFGALSLVNGVAKVNREKCVGCMQCVATCPKRLITKLPYSSETRVGCNSHARGAAVRKLCEAGCIGCGICVKNCPNDAIRVEDNLAIIDPAKCHNCGICVEKCPRHIIESVVSVRAEAKV
ncbi:MAG: RnfABCDGE type electron transport complex subunit B [Oscillospiraceae bacterium]|jgi:RnfABCDGE-type electron transport complex B subunit|nr:RnfABCDGE type electron transport complex subunit B [Oscillospiraceae bacterium]